MQTIGDQHNAKHQLKNDGQSRNNERKIETEKMIAVNVNLELVHVQNLEDSRDDEHKAQQDLQCRFTDRIRQFLGLVIVSTAK